MPRPEPKVEDILKGIDNGTKGDPDLGNLSKFKGNEDNNEPSDETLENQEPEVEEDDNDNTDDEDNDLEDEGTEEKPASVLEKVAPLSAKFKEADDKIEEARDELAWFREQSKQGKTDLFKDLPEVPVAGRSLYTLTPDEKDNLVDAILVAELPAAEKSRRVKLIESNYAKYQDRQERAEKLADERELNINNYEWQKVREAMLDKEDGDPRLEKYVAKISEWIDNQLKLKPFKAVKLAAGGAEAKAKMVVEAIKALKIDEELDGSRKQSRPNLEPPAVGNGAKQNVSGKEKPRFTRKQIAKMSVEEFEKNEAEIFKAAGAGRIK